MRGNECNSEELGTDINVRQPETVMTNDARPYSAQEMAGPIAPMGQLSFGAGNGKEHISPLPENVPHPEFPFAARVVPDAQAPQGLSGIDEICGHDGYRR